MKIYEKYLLKNLAKYFLLVLSIITSIIWTTRVIRYIKYITEYGLELKGFMEVIFNVIPNLLLITIPISAFITIIFYYNRMIKNNELIILKNSGLRQFDLIKPPLFLSIFLFIFTFINTAYFIPKNNKEFENIKSYLKNSITSVLLNKANNFNDFENITIYSKSIEDNNLNSMTIYIKSDGKDIDKIIYAKKGIVESNNITLLDGNLQEFNTKNKDIKLLFFGKYVLDISQYYNIDDIETKYDQDSLFLNELFKIENKNQKVVAKIIEILVSPFIPIVLVIFSSILVLNLNFSRMDNDKQLFLIYLVCIADFTMFLYSIKTLEKHMYGIYIMIFSLIFPTMWCYFSKKVKNY